MLKLTWMHLKQKVTSLMVRIGQLSWKIKALFVVLLLLAVYLFIYIPEKYVQFSYNGSTCTQRLTFLPSLNTLSTSNSDYTVENKDIIGLGNVQLFSLRTCFNAVKAPSVGDNKLSVGFLGSWFAQKTFKINVSQPPSLQTEVLTNPISIIEPITLELSATDLVFSYQLKIGDIIAPCPIKDGKITCDILVFHLLQGENYTIELDRMFGQQKVANLSTKSIKTITATTVVSSSVQNDQIVFDSPKTFLFEFDKDIIQGDITLEKVVGDTRVKAETTTLFDKKQATVTLVGDLERDTSYEFTIDNIRSQDSSSLASKYKLDFTASDGPIVISTDIDTISAPLTRTITLTFDQNLQIDQDITNFVSTTGIATTITKLDNQVFIRYADAPLCTDLNINIKPGLLSNHGVIQNDPWSFSIRTVCHTTSIIGYSVLGRQILAYTFGSGATAILFTGGIHGDEPSGSYIMYDFISYLESNAEKIPADKKIVIIPEVNPDGIATFSRYNSNNVNIDRNFPSVSWVADIDSSEGLVIGGGGASALSEPETRALADLTTSLQPRLEVSFHAQGSLLGANQLGDSIAIADMYALSVGYSSMIGYAEETMGYTITGEYEEWAGEQYGTPAILIELPSASGSYFWAHQPTLLTVINI